MPALQAQDKLMLTEQNGLFKEVYWVNASDKLIKDGKSTTYYKGKVIEQGRYFDNKRVGRWQFYNLNSILDYEYDFDNDELVRVSGIERHDLKRKSPCLFMGSPLIPYLFLVDNLSYPTKAIDNDVEGEIVLALKVNKEGMVYGFYISQKLHPVLDRAVIDCVKTMPADWRFIPATNSGQNVGGEYHITIEFDLEYVHQ
ncbi:TonB family protein [Carboxylicivirga sp. A043]|uniref:energy transducer TonB n=1 Tax=Carboxylicivirga litoralis TaxID=2816963 RepID=UPI0021CB2448|nr:energy transducer TonB [Carboxylicivirga sp. A043]MCU4156755.1 TonB family protein [Carboxylicivirga sp. A043]